MKPFQHRDKFFIIYKSKAPNWIGCGYALHCPDNKFDPKLHNFDNFVFYVQDVDTLWTISVKDLLEHRAKYNGRWHIDRNFLTQIQITDEWRKYINAYKREGKCPQE